MGAARRPIPLAVSVGQHDVYRSCGSSAGSLVRVLVFRRSKPDAAEFDVALELERADTLTSPLLPGFALALGAVFA